MKLDDAAIDYEGTKAFLVLTKISGGKRFIHRVPVDLDTAKHIDTALVQVQFESQP